MDDLTIDRIEGDKAVCEHPDGSTSDIPLSELPAGVKEGTCLTAKGGSYVVDAEAAAKRAARIQKKMDSLFKD